MIQRKEGIDMGKRSSVVDIYKGIGIVLVLMGHIGFGTPSSYIAHAFHMPMFFFISGFLFFGKSTENFSVWIRKKVKSLLIPYLIFGVFNYLFWIVIQMQKGESISLSPVYHLLFVNTTGLASGSLWFLTALFFTNLIWYFIHKYIKNPICQGIVVAIIGHMGIFAAECLPVRLPYAIDAGMVGVLLFYAGYLLKKYEDRKFIYHLFHLPIWELIVGIIVICFLIYQHDEVNMRTGTYNNIILFWVNALAGSILVYNVAAWLRKLGECGVVFEYIIRLGQRIGSHSIWYVCMNDLLNVEILYLFSVFITEKSKLITATTHSLTLLLTVAVIETIIRYTPITKLIKGR